MTTEEILTRVNEALATCRNGSTPFPELSRLSEALEDQLRHEIAAQRGTGSAERTIAAMLKAEQDTRPALAYPWIDSEGRQCMCNGYLAYRLKNHLPLPERPESVGKGVDLDRIFPASLAGWKSLPMPSAHELKAFIATERAKLNRAERKSFEPQWSFGPNAPSVNAKYMLDLVTVFPNADTLFWNTVVSPLVVTCDGSDAMIMPLRVQGKVQPAPQSDAEREAIQRENAEKERNLREAQERAEIIRKAHEDFDAAREDMRQALLRQDELRKQARNAVEPSERNAIARELAKAFEADGKARLRQYAATSVWEPTHAMEPVEFEAIVKRLYAGDRLSA